MMKNYITILFLGLVLTESCSQKNENLALHIWLEKFTEVDLPFDYPKNIPEGIHSNNPSNISKTEFEQFIKNDKMTLVYDEFSYYNRLGRFSIGTNLTGVIILSSYIPDEIEKEKEECILILYNLSGEIQDVLVIGGEIGDDENIYSVIDKNFNIKIRKELFDFDKESKSSKLTKINLHYDIDKENGKISKIDIME